MIKRILKKINMRRVFPVLCALVIFFSCTPLSVSAASVVYDWMDLAEIYITTPEAEPPQHALTLKFPLQSCFIYLWEDGKIAQKAVYQDGKVSLTRTLKFGHHYRLTIGFQSLWTHNIPSAWDVDIIWGVYLTGLNWNNDLYAKPKTFFSSTYDDGFDHSETSEWNNDWTKYNPDTKILSGRAFGPLYNRVDSVSVGAVLRDFMVNKDLDMTVEIEEFFMDLRIPVEFWDSWKQADRDKIADKNTLLLQNQELLLNDMINEQQTTNEKMDDVIGGTAEQNNQVAGALDGMSQSTDKLDQMGDTLNSVEKPSADDMNVGISDLVPYSALLAYTSPIQALWENKTLLGFLIIVLTLVLVSWVMFGKKG